VANDLRMIGRVTTAACLAALFLAAPRPAAAYSVLAHQAAVDMAWEQGVVPLVRQRFPGVTAAQLAEARAYTYGGALIQDLGYYPFGSHLFTDLAHYVRTGDLVESLIRQSRDVNEYAFALGALAHYACDNAGHPLAVNRAVPIVYPKVRARVGNEALYVDDPARHLMVEFAFDVLQVARGDYVSEAFRSRIGFEVSKDLLERAVLETYGLELGDLLFNVDLAIATYRHAIGTTIPEMTRLAWRDKREEIEKRTPGITEDKFVFRMSRREYDTEFGNRYRKPGLLSRMLAFVLKIVPKVGPFRALAFEPPTPETERLFEESAAAAQERYRAALTALRQGRLDLVNTDFDTGKLPKRGENRLADETFVALRKKLAGRTPDKVPEPLRRTIAAYFSVAP
jgi:hypothetical protein